MMKEYENNVATSNDNPENNIALCIATLIITLHISISLRRNRLIEKYFMLFTQYMRPWPSSSFNCLFFQEDSLFRRSKKSGEVTLLLDSKPISVFCHMGDFGCGDGGWTPIMKINGNKVKIRLRTNSLLIHDGEEKRQMGWAKSAGFP